MARRYMISPTFTRADLTEGETAPNVDQHFMQVHRMDKPRLLARLLQAPDRGNVYVFVRTKHMADRLVEELGELGSEAIAIHGDLRQATRERNLDRFRDGKVGVLVATEVAARGLDVDNVTHVVNYDCPEDEKMYLHRIGRTARAGRAGVAVTFVEHNEVERANLIRRAIDRTDLEVRPMFSTSPELTALFGLPAEVPWARSVARRRAPEDGDSGRGGRSGGRGGERGGRGGGRDGEKRGGDRGGERGEKRERGRRDGDEPRASEQHERERGAPRESDRPRDGEKRERQRAPRAAESTDAPDAPATDSSEGEARTSRRRRGGRGRGRGGRGEANGTETGTNGSTERESRSEQREPREAREPRASSEPRDGEPRAERSEGGRRRGGRGRSRREDGGEPKADSPRNGGSRTRTVSNEPSQRDTSSRGEGQPQLARRVKVEHLP
jgi:superfamily II DNA/RNA helicase